MAAVSDIIRYGGDTYPSKSVLSINGIPVDLDGWDVELRYYDEESKLTHVIDCVIIDAPKGRIDIYPHSRLDSEPKLSYSEFVSLNDAVAQGNENLSNQCWMEGGNYPFSIIRKKIFNTYEEVMTHHTGIIKILDRI
jgi:hypothetical protein